MHIPTYTFPNSIQFVLMWQVKNAAGRSFSLINLIIKLHSFHKYLGIVSKKKKGPYTSPNKNCASVNKYLQVQYL